MADVVLINGTRHVVWQCRTCGVFATCPEIVNDQLRAEGGYRSCPSGHQWGWSKEASESEQIRRERDRLKQSLAEKDDEIARQTLLRKQAEGKLSQSKARIVKIKNRVGHGVCPCCNRTFENLARHIGTKHPTFTAEAAE